MEKTSADTNLGNAALEVAFFLGAIGMIDILFRDEVDDERKHRRYVTELCESNAPHVPMEMLKELVLDKLEGASRSWVRDWYLRRAALS